ncbi:MAG: ATP synthase subunit I [Bryobacteraceae bacterium]
MEPERAIPRIGRLMLALALGGTAACFAVGGWPWGIGFALGAGVSWLNFRWLKRVVDHLGAASEGVRTPKKMAVLVGLRYLILGLAAYVIVKYSTLSLTAALIGLFVSVAAIILEILFELIYAGT